MMEKTTRRFSASKYTMSFNSLYKEFPDRKTITKEEYSAIERVFGMLASLALIERGVVFRLPKALGLLYVRKWKTKLKKSYPDYKHYLLTGEKRTIKAPPKREIATAYWEKIPLYTKLGAPHGKFKFTRTNNRNMARLIKESGAMLNYTEIQK